MAQFCVAVDLGGTQIRALLADASCEVANRAAALTLGAEGPEAVIGRIEATIRQVVGDTPWNAIQGIAIAAPGPIDDQGAVLGAPNLPGWEHLPLRAILARTFGAPVQVGNDANLAALGEHVFGAGRGVKNLVYMTISTGIGGGVITNGQLLVGARGFAGEIGHQTLVVENGPLCGCGNHGCLEALASGTAIGRMGREAAARGEGKRLLDLAQGNLEAIDSKIVGKAALEGNRTAQAIVRCAATYIGTGLANLCNILNPELFILGGGVTKIGPLLFDTIRATTVKRAMPATRQVRVVPAALGDDVVLLGALALANNRHCEEP